ncbi:MAG: hypothetical protein ACFFDB_00815 [Promethearchaeota archaeon]
MKSNNKKSIILTILAILIGFAMFSIGNFNNRQASFEIDKKPTNQAPDEYILPGPISDHIWSPDGTKVAYIKSPSSQTWNCELWVADKNPTTAELVNHQLIYTGANYNWLYDWKDDWILFSIRFEEDSATSYYGRRELWKIRSDGTSLTQITFTHTNGIRTTSSNPRWVREGTVSWGAFIPGTNLVYFSAHNGNGWYRSYVCNDDGTDNWQHISYPDYSFTISLSPTGNKLLWGHATYWNNPTTLRACNIDGSGRTTIRSFTERTGSLVLADGNTVIWHYNDNIYAINMDGSNERTVIDDENINKWWTHNPIDGQELIMGSDRADGNMHLFKIKTDGTGIVQLTNGLYIDEYPLYSPDAQYLMYRRLPFNFDTDNTPQPWPYELVVKSLTPSNGISPINLITPENKTYIEPMYGYYPATYGFENEPEGTKGTALTFLDEYFGQSPAAYTDIKVGDGPVAGHSKYISVSDSQAGTNTWGVHHIDNPQSSGTIEFYLWANNPTTVGSSTKRQYIYFRAMDDTIAFRMMIFLSSEKLQYYDGSTWQDLAYTSPEVWYHHSIFFDCETGINGQFTWVVSDEQGSEIGRVENQEFENDLSTIDEIYIGTHVSDYRGHTKWDAFGFSWDPNYNVGDNLKEGLLIGFETSQSLNWIGYSLDGQDNVTISGNYTIATPVNGTHTIQVFGTDSIGTNYQSDLRFFTYGISSIPHINIISPIYNEVFGYIAPNFLISKSGASLNETWYTIDEGITNITFSGLTGTIDQAEWDKKEDGLINLRFYINDTMGNETMSEVNITKDITDPIMTVNAPIENEVFGKPPPDFNLTVVEVHLDSMWYTLDDGITNITINNLNGTGTINQIEWDKFGNDTVTIKFYVRDQGNNEVSDEVTVIKEISDPIITINSPITNELFGFTAPQYNISIIEPDLDSMWYTIDNGITNMSFSSLTGMIDQTEWNKKTSGIYIIKFYARDILGNIGYAEVTVEKDITSPFIQINSPTSTDVFGQGAPYFDVTITDSYLDSMWYTVDNGLTNIPLFSLTGAIDQTEWDKRGSGTVPIRFYANDTMGNVNYKEVILTKDLISPLVIINSPFENEIFGSLAPSFDILVLEMNLDYMWYTLDNGLTNIPLISFTGTIDQTEWNKKGTGIVSIKFYAMDEGGNLGFAEVNVEKDIDLPIITINTPIMNNFYGPNAPHFDLSIQEPNIDLMWYTLDFGINSAYFNDFTGTIDQTEWDKFSNGTVIIRFYVRDKGGNEAYSEIIVKKDIFAPVITIITPEIGDIFVDFPPIYSITVDDPNLDSIWFTLDEGITNTTITDLTGVIDLNPWESIPDGHTTLKFYAMDKAGNIGEDSVIITKRSTPDEIPPLIPGYDLFIVIGILAVASLVLYRKWFKK